MFVSVIKLQSTENVHKQYEGVVGLLVRLISFPCVYDRSRSSTDVYQKMLFFLFLITGVNS